MPPQPTRVSAVLHNSSDIISVKMEYSGENAFLCEDCGNVSATINVTLRGIANLKSARLRPVDPAASHGPSTSCELCQFFDEAIKQSPRTIVRNFKYNYEFVWFSRRVHTELEHVGNNRLQLRSFATYEELEGVNRRFFNRNPPKDEELASCSLVMCSSSGETSIC